MRDLNISGTHQHFDCVKASFKPSHPLIKTRFSTAEFINSHLTVTRSPFICKAENFHLFKVSSDFFLCINIQVSLHKLNPYYGTNRSKG